MSNESPVYLIDASIYLFRAWYSMPDAFENRRGQPTNAVYGFAGFLCSLLEQTDAQQIGVAFDISLTSSFRNEIYADYKANRDPAPKELERQFAWAQELVTAMGMRSFADPRFEADDLIGTLARHWRALGYPVTVVTGDKDLAQLIGERDHWWDFAGNRRLGHDEVTKKFGVRPDQLVDFLALTGDKVDNIPGVPGVGAKTAAALLAHFDDLDSLFQRLAEVPHVRIRGAKTLAAKLEMHRATAMLARRLTGIETTVASALENPELARSAPDKEQLNSLFDELSFGNMLRQRCLRLAS